MPVIDDPMLAAGRRGTIYPPPHDQGFEGRVKRALTGLLGLTQLGVNLTTLEPGAMSAQRHWHTSEDECVYVIEGEITLVTDEGATLLGPGMVAGFPKGERNGHHLVNRSAEPAHYLEIGTRCRSALLPTADSTTRMVRRATTRARGFAITRCRATRRRSSGAARTTGSGRACGTRPGRAATSWCARPTAWSSPTCRRFAPR